VSVDLIGNAIDSMQFGIMLIDNPATAGVSISLGLLVNCVYGLYAQEGSIAMVDGDSSYLLDAMEFVNPSAYAIYINDTDSISVATTNVLVQNGTIVLGGSNGVGVEGTGAVLAFNGADPLEFIGVVELLRSADQQPEGYRSQAGSFRKPDRSSNVKLHFGGDRREDNRQTRR